jgi:hypothetical protein
MSEEADNSTSTTAPVAAAAAPPPPASPPPPVVVPTEERPRRNRVTQIAAWVGIVAGVTFVVAVIFFSGFILGKHSDGGGHHRGGPDRESGMFHRGGPPMGPPHIFFPGGPGAQGGPGSGPGAQGGPGAVPGFQGPQQGQSPGPGNAPATPPRP